MMLQGQGALNNQSLRLGCCLPPYPNSWLRAWICVCLFLCITDRSYFSDTYHTYTDYSFLLSTVDLAHMCFKIFFCQVSPKKLLAPSRGALYPAKHVAMLLMIPFFACTAGWITATRLTNLFHIYRKVN